MTFGIGRHMYGYKSEVTETRSPEEIAFDKLPTEAVRRVVTRAMASEEEKRAAEQFQLDEQVFRKMQPAYINNEHNMKVMQHSWRERFGVEIPTIEQLEDCYFDCRGAGLLHLNGRAVAKEDAAAIAQRADEIIATRKQADDDAARAYTMPMDELRERAMGWRK